MNRINYRTVGGSVSPWRHLRRGLVCGTLSLGLVGGCRIVEDSPHGETARQQKGAEEVNIRVAILQFRPELKNLQANISAITELTTTAFSNGANIVVAPEQATTGFGINAEEVRNGLGLSEPFRELQPLAQLAAKHDGYVTIGIAEIGLDDKLYNSAVTFGPDGRFHVQRKRLAAANTSFGWNSRGDNAFEVIHTPYGDLGILICADTFSMDWIRILTLEGADIVLVPANWWGENDQLALWQTRSKQNGVWIVVANRWGAEPNTFPPPINYYMSDGPSAVVDPHGKIRLSSRADDDAGMHNRILYHTLQVPRHRIGPNAENPTPTVRLRRPSAYAALQNEYYAPPSGNPAPSLPQEGLTRVKVLTHVPSVRPSDNFATLNREVTAGSADVVVLPGLSYVDEVDSTAKPPWYMNDDWTAVQSFVENSGLKILVTSTVEQSAAGRSLSTVVLRPGMTPQLVRQIHDWGSLRGSGKEPLVLDLPHARVAVLTGIDSLFPEIAVAVAKRGADIVLVSSAVLGRGTAVIEQNALSSDLPRGWTIASLQKNWLLMAKSCFHLVSADTSGHGAILQQSTYCMLRKAIRIGPYNAVEITLDSASQRTKNLNWYYPFDIQELLPESVLTGDAADASD